MFKVLFSCAACVFVQCWPEQNLQIVIYCQLGWVVQKPINANPQ